MLGLRIEKKSEFLECVYEEFLRWRDCAEEETEKGYAAGRRDAMARILISLSDGDSPGFYDALEFMESGVYG